MKSDALSNSLEKILDEYGQSFNNKAFLRRLLLAIPAAGQ